MEPEFPCFCVWSMAICTTKNDPMVCLGEHIPGVVLHAYLTAFAKKFDVFERTHFSTRVESLEPMNEGGWTVVTSSPDGEQVLQTNTIIIATRPTS